MKIKRYITEAKLNEAPIDDINWDGSDKVVAEQVINFIRNDLKLSNAADLLSKFDAQFVCDWIESIGKNALSDPTNLFLGMINSKYNNVFTSRNNFIDAYNLSLDSTLHLSTDYIKDSKCILYLNELYKYLDDSKRKTVIEYDVNLYRGEGTYVNSKGELKDASEIRKDRRDTARTWLAERVKDRKINQFLTRQSNSKSKQSRYTTTEVSKYFDKLSKNQITTLLSNSGVEGGIARAAAEQIVSDRVNNAR